jgi:hypothetical protein
MLVVDNNHHFGTSVPGAGAIHPIWFGLNAVLRRPDQCFRFGSTIEFREEELLLLRSGYV